jgi:NADH dehydrogenase FAD-containing subunit
VARPSVVVVGGGFAGFFAARTLERLLPPEAADLTLISATDHLCYSPLLPEVASGRLDPRRIAVPLHAGLSRARIIQAWTSRNGRWTSWPAPDRSGRCTGTGWRSPRAA